MGKFFVCLACSALVFVAAATALRAGPTLIMSYDYDDWSMKPPAIDTFLDVLKTAGFNRVHWRVAHEKGFLYRSRDAVTATSRLNALGGPDFDPVVYGVQAGHKRNIQVYSYVDDWENMGFLGKWGEEHPDFCLMTRGGTRWTGGISYAYPEGRAFRLIPARETAQLGVDGVYLENFSWHGGGPPSARIGFEPPVAEFYKAKYGVDILTQPFDLVKLKEVQGEFYRQFLIDAKKSLKPGQRLAFSYPFSQTNDMYHLPILDLKKLMSDKIIDDLILGVWFGTDYDCWLTQEGWDKAKEWSDFCHKNGTKFTAYIYTDAPYFVAWERFGAPGVRSRWLGDHGWLVNTGVDGFTNRNVPEMLCAHGAPGVTNRETISKYLAPIGEQLWSGAAEGIKAKPGSIKPLWTPGPLPQNAPVVLVLMPASVKKMGYPMSFEADYFPETFRGMARQYRTLFTNLGCRMELADTQEKLEASLTKPRAYLALVLAHQCWNEVWVKNWLEKNSPQLLDYVKGGGTLIAEAGFNSPIARLLDLTSEPGMGTGAVFNIPQASLPKEMRPFLPAQLDPRKNIGGYNVFRNGVILPDAAAPSAYNPAKLPGWAIPVATLPGTDGKAWPVVVAGDIGKGKVVCTTTFLLANEMVTINPADGPDVPEVMRLWQAIGHWLQPGRKLPIDRAMLEQDRRFAKMAENPLANGGFEEGWLMGHPAYWMAEGKQAGVWIKNGQGVSLDRTDKVEGKQSLCLDSARVASLTSLTFPVQADKTYVLSGKMKAAPRTIVSVKVLASSGSAGDMYVKPDKDWADFQLPLKPLPKDKSGSSKSDIAARWVEIGLPGGSGKVWLDGFKVTEVK